MECTQRACVHRAFAPRYSLQRVAKSTFEASLEDAGEMESYSKEGGLVGKGDKRVGVVA